MTTEHRAARRVVTLKDVAQRAGVSTMTVSNVINEKFGGMTPETRERIERAIRELGYRPHVGARGLRRGRGFSVAMLVVDRSPTYLADPWITNLVAGVSNWLNSRNYGLLIQGAHPASVKDLSLLRHVVSDGLCVLLSGPQRGRTAALRHLMKAHQPIVLFQDDPPARAEDICVVRQDDRGGALALARMVLGRRPKRVVLLTSDWDWAALKERELGIRDAIAELDGPVVFDVIPCREGDFDAVMHAFARYIDTQGLPDAVFSGNDQMGIAAMKHLRSRGVSVPRDVVVTGFNAFEFWKYSEPVLTTVRSPAYELGERGAAALLERLETGRFAQAEIVVPVEVQLGGSTLPPPKGAARSARSAAGPSESRRPLAKDGRRKVATNGGMTP